MLLTQTDGASPIPTVASTPNNNLLCETDQHIRKGKEEKR